MNRFPMDGFEREDACVLSYREEKMPLARFILNRYEKESANGKIESRCIQNVKIDEKGVILGDKAMFIFTFDVGNQNGYFRFASDLRHKDFYMSLSSIDYAAILNLYFKPCDADEADVRRVREIDRLLSEESIK